MTKKTGESADSEISCSHSITNYDVILWYKQDKHKGLKLLGYLNLDYPYPESDVKDKINLTGDGRKESQLTVSRLSPADSGVYFCAASYTVLQKPRGLIQKHFCVRQGDQAHEHLHQAPYLFIQL